MLEVTVTTTPKRCERGKFFHVFCIFVSKHNTENTVKDRIQRIFGLNRGILVVGDVLNQYVCDYSEACL